jgi:rhamnosyltransferase
MKNSDFPKVLVLLCTSNSLKYLEKQLETIFEQKDVNVTIMCSDDNSSDGTYEYLSQIQLIDKRLIVLPRLQKFGSAGKNFYNLILNADYKNYDFISFSDHDDIWKDNKLISAIDILNSGNYQAYSSSFDAFWDDGKKKYFSKVGKNVKFDYLFASPGPGCTFVTTSRSMLEFKNYFQKHQIGEDIFHHDWLVYAWFKCNFPNSWFIDKNSYIFYRQHYGNETGVNSGIKAFKKRFKLIINGWYFSEIKKVLLFLSDSPQFSDVNKLFSHGKFYILLNVKLLRRDLKGQLVLFILILFNIISIGEIKNLLSDS